MLFTKATLVLGSCAALALALPAPADIHAVEVSTPVAPAPVPALTPATSNKNDDDSSLAEEIEDKSPECRACRLQCNHDHPPPLCWGLGRCYSKCWKKFNCNQAVAGDDEQDFLDLWALPEGVKMDDEEPSEEPAAVTVDISNDNIVPPDPDAGVWKDTPECRKAKEMCTRKCRSFYCEPLPDRRTRCLENNLLEHCYRPRPADDDADADAAAASLDPREEAQSEVEAPATATNELSNDNIVADAHWWKDTPECREVQRVCWQPCRGLDCFPDAGCLRKHHAMHCYRPYFAADAAAASLDPREVAQSEEEVEAPAIAELSSGNIVPDGDLWDPECIKARRVCDQPCRGLDCFPDRACYKLHHAEHCLGPYAADAVAASLNPREEAQSEAPAPAAELPSGNIVGDPDDWESPECMTALGQCKPPFECFFLPRDYCLKWQAECLKHLNAEHCFRPHLAANADADAAAASLEPREQEAQSEEPAAELSSDDIVGDGNVWDTPECRKARGICSRLGRCDMLPPSYCSQWEKRCFEEQHDEHCYSPHAANADADAVADAAAASLDPREDAPSAEEVEAPAPAPATATGSDPFDILDQDLPADFPPDCVAARQRCNKDHGPPFYWGLAACNQECDRRLHCYRLVAGDAPELPSLSALELEAASHEPCHL